MEHKDQAQEIAKKLAVEGRSASAIQSELDKNGYGGLLDPLQIEMIVTEARAAANLIPKRPSHVWPRILGIVAVLMGFGGLALDDFAGSSHRYHPYGAGLLAVILGIILILKPGWAGERLK
ncbi:MAG: hypothetical protein QM627_07525 [Luteolibacter sp.]